MSTESIARNLGLIVLGTMRVLGGDAGGAAGASTGMVALTAYLFARWWDSTQNRIQQAVRRAINDVKRSPDHQGVNWDLAADRLADAAPTFALTRKEVIAAFDTERGKPPIREYPDILADAGLARLELEAIDGATYSAIRHALVAAMREAMQDEKMANRIRDLLRLEVFLNRETHDGLREQDLRSLARAADLDKEVPLSDVVRLVIKQLASSNAEAAEFAKMLYLAGQRYTDTALSVVVDIQAGEFQHADETISQLRSTTENPAHIAELAIASTHLQILKGISPEAALTILEAALDGIAREHPDIAAFARWRGCTVIGGYGIRFGQRACKAAEKLIHPAITWTSGRPDPGIELIQWSLERAGQLYNFGRQTVDAQSIEALNESLSILNKLKVRDLGEFAFFVANARGNTLLEQGRRAEGEKAEGILRSAIDAFEQADRELARTDEDKTISGNFAAARAMALLYRAELATGPERSRSLSGAGNFAKSAVPMLLAGRRDTYPSQMSLGLFLLKKGDMSTGGWRTRHYNSASVAFQFAEESAFRKEAPLRQLRTGFHLAQIRWRQATMNNDQEGWHETKSRLRDIAETVFALQAPSLGIEALVEIARIAAQVGVREERQAGVSALDEASAILEPHAWPRMARRIESLRTKLAA